MSYPYSHLDFDDINAVHTFEPGTAPEWYESKGTDVEAAETPNRGYYSGGESNFIRNFPPIPPRLGLSLEDVERVALLSRSNQSESSSSDSLRTWCQKYLNSSKKFVRSRKVNLAVSTLVLLGSLIFIGMGVGYMDKCRTPLSLPTYCVFIGGAGITFAVSNILILVESCRIRNRYNVFEWLTPGTLLTFGILSAIALWRLTQAEFVPALVIENAYKCDPVFLAFLKISTSVGIVFALFMAVVYLPLLFCCQSRCRCYRCC